MSRMGSNRGHLLERALLNGAVTPEPIAPNSSGDGRPRLTNYVLSGEGQDRRRTGLSMPSICDELFRLTDNWPRRVGNLLFVPGLDFTPRYLADANQLMAWLDSQMCVDWGHGSDMITQQRFFAHLNETAQAYRAVERYPHWPDMPDTYYLCPELPATSGEYLEEFLDFFPVATCVDRQLLKAFIASLFWGGRPGTRPAWLITARDSDPSGGRGTGKSILADIIFDLAGGYMEVMPGEDMSEIKTRMLSPDAMRFRAARLDNLKSLRFSWAELESLLTAPTISGRRLYAGEGQRPNTFVWAITVNGASLSRDLAQRVMVIEVFRPQYTAQWEDRVRGYIEHNRWQLINDIGLFLTREAI
jgi:hypothetical protein